MTQQPDALRLADAMSLAFPGNLGIDKAAAELRRLHHNNEVLMNALWKACGDDESAVALRLAECLTRGDSGYSGQAAAELRRLHAENEAIKSELRTEQVISFRTQMQSYAAQRDALLEALKLSRLMLIEHGEAHAKIDDAIKAVEGQK